MAKLASMPPVVVSQADLALFGEAWQRNGNRLSRTPPQSSSQLGNLFDEAVGKSLAVMLGGIPVAKPNAGSLTAPEADCVEVGPVRVIGGVRPQNFDVGYCPDGVRFAFEGIRTMAVSIRNFPCLSRFCESKGFQYSLKQLIPIVTGGSRRTRWPNNCGRSLKLGKPDLSYQKLRGGYYTPKPIAGFLARWAINSSFDRVLEPSCGDGVLVEAAINVLIEHGADSKDAVKSVKGVEVDEAERLKTLARIQSLGFRPRPRNFHSGDFFAYCKENLADTDLLAICDQRKTNLFDAVIGNPPFIRYQNFQEEHRKPAFEIMQRAGLSPNRLTNSWVPFVVASSLILSEKGRLALVIPAELLQVNYAAELRRFLEGYFRRITLITFKKLVFNGIQQEVVLVLAERSGNGVSGIRTVELNEMGDLAGYEHTDFINRELKPMNHSTEKWTQYFLSKKEIGLLRELRTHPHLSESGKVIDVDVGIVTGQNDFFVLNGEQTKALSVERFTRRLVSRSGHLRGIIFSEENWRHNAGQNLPAFLLDLPDKELSSLPKSVQSYIAFGESAGFNSGFKCRIRNKWFVVPSVWAPDAFMLRQVHGYPKLILNRAGATCTDTIHRVRFRNGAAGGRVVSSFLNSLTFAFAEVTGRSYGGGVLELEPNEAERLPLPLKNAEKLDITALNELLLSDRINDVLDITDQVLLADGLGISMKDRSALLGIWQKMRDRRINRKHSVKFAL